LSNLSDKDRNQGIIKKEAQNKLNKHQNNRCSIVAIVLHKREISTQNGGCVNSTHPINEYEKHSRVLHGKGKEAIRSSIRKVEIEK